MNSTVIAILVLAMIVSQGLIMRSVLSPTGKSNGDMVRLSPEVKTYIDSHTAGAGGSNDEITRLLKKVADLEQQAARFEYLRSTLTALEESQLRLGKVSLDSAVTIDALIAPARERELQKFRIALEDICSAGGANSAGKASQAPGVKGKPLFLETPKAKAGR